MIEDADLTPKQRKTREYGRAYYEKHKEAVKARKREENRRRREADPDYDKRIADAYRSRHPDRVRASAKKQYKKNREARLAKNKEWHKANPEYEKERNRRRNEANPNRHAEQYAAKKETMKARAAAWRKENPKRAREILNKSEHKRRSKKAECTEHYTLGELRELFEKCGNRCAYCKKKKKLTVDHIVPLAKGGANSIRNIQFLCKPCNSSKCDSDPIEWAQKKGLLL
jgi:5-methylcytosine-specific restriction endonuclease McrA